MKTDIMMYKNIKGCDSNFEENKIFQILSWYK